MMSYQGFQKPHSLISRNFWRPRSSCVLVRRFHEILFTKPWGSRNPIRWFHEIFGHHKGASQVHVWNFHKKSLELVLFDKNLSENYSPSYLCNLADIFKSFTWSTSTQAFSTEICFPVLTFVNYLSNNQHLIFVKFLANTLFNLSESLVSLVFKWNSLWRIHIWQVFQAVQALILVKKLFS